MVDSKDNAHVEFRVLYAMDHWVTILRDWEEVVD